MGILQRFTDIMSANINSLLTGAEEKNAGKLLEKYLNDARANLEELKSETSAIIADEMAIGMVNQKTTAVRIIPVIGKGVGETVEFGGLLGYAPIMPVNAFSCDAFVNRGGRIPAPIHSFKN